MLVQNNNFLQSEEWRKFQEAVGRRTFFISSESFYASIIEHSLPIVGNYFYIPRGPIINIQESGKSEQEIQNLLELAKKEKAGWARFDPENQEVLEKIKKSTKLKIVKAPHDVQPKQLFMIDISGPEEEILAKMKSKTRYNIRLAEKKNIQIKIGEKYLEDFLRLTKIMAKRQGITPHPDKYYRKMLETIPEEMIKLYAAEYENKVIAANLVIFYPVKYSQGESGVAGFNRVNGDTAIYLHGASDDEYRNVMAPYLLQWRAIQEAKQKGCTKYDFGGVRTEEQNNNWAGITRFKLGFAPNTKPIEFPGSYDIIINPMKYWLYRIIQRVKSIL